MINQPDTQELLTEARRVLLEELLPQLPEERQYEARMVASTLGMTIRELEQRRRGEPLQTEAMLLDFLAGQGLSVESELPEATLARALRERRLDGADPGLRALLRRLTETRLKINKPGYLKK